MVYCYVEQLTTLQMNATVTQMSEYRFHDWRGQFKKKNQLKLY